MRLNNPDPTLRQPAARVALPVGPQEVATILDRWTIERPHADALIDRHRRLDFEALNDEVAAAAAFLESLGIQRGDRVALSAPNCIELVVAFLAVQRLGAIWVGINLHLAPPEMQYILDDAGVAAFIADRRTLTAGADFGSKNRILLTLSNPAVSCDWSQGLRRFAGRIPIARQIDPWAPAALAYTSGTTGRPKGVLHSQHSMVLAATIAALNSGRFDADVVRGTATPLTILNLMILGPICAFVTGARHVCMDRVDAAGVAEWIRRERVNTLSLPPPTINDLASMVELPRETLSSVEWMVIGGAHVSLDKAELFEQHFGKPVTIGYGQTECPTGMTMTWSDTPRLAGCVGRAHRHLQVTVRNDAGEEMPLGQSGEVCYRATPEGLWANVYSGPMGYWGKPEATEDLWKNGWVHSGDIGYLDVSGNLYIQDRRSDVIIRGGANVYPAEVERVLRMHGSTRDCAVIGIPDARLGEIVGAAIEGPRGCSADELIDQLSTLCSRELAKYKIPVRWIVLDEIPRNAMRKVSREPLRALLAAAADRTPQSSDRGGVQRGFGPKL